MSLASTSRNFEGKERESNVSEAQESSFFPSLCYTSSFYLSVKHLLCVMNNKFISYNKPKKQNKKKEIV